MVTLKVVSVAIVACLVGAVVGGVAAYELWAGDITWQYQQVNYDFSVVGEQNIDYGLIVGSGIKSAIYNVTNTGNTELTILASCVPSAESTVSASWDKTSATIGIGETAQFTLTLVITGPGNCTVNFSKQP